ILNSVLFIATFPARTRGSRTAKYPACPCQCTFFKSGRVRRKRNICNPGTYNAYKIVAYLSKKLFPENTPPPYSISFAIVEIAVYCLGYSVILKLGVSAISTSLDVLPIFVLFHFQTFYSPDIEYLFYYYYNNLFLSCHIRYVL